MSADVESLVDAGRRALDGGEWPVARASFEAALERHHSAEALRGLAEALWWLGETHASVRARETACAASSANGDLAEAALDGIQLCLIYRASLGNAAASHGWLTRAARLAEQAGPVGLDGWILLCRASVANDDGKRAEAHDWASQALEAARASGDMDLELCALSEMGSALLALGQLEQGTALLDEAMAAALAEGRPDTVVYTSCRTITGCSRSWQVRRAAQWVRAADDFTRRYGSPHLYAVCRIHHGRVLVANGRWPEAEEELRAALELARAGEPGLQAEALAVLAGLRVDQGRTDEAERLLEGLDDRPQAAEPLAAVRLAGGDPDAAIALLQRRLHELADSDAASPLELLVEAEIARGRQDAAVQAAQRLAVLAERTRCEVAGARAERALGRVSTDQPAGGDRLRTAIARFSELEMPVEAARAGLLLAEALREVDRPSAVHEVRSACLCFERIGARPDADRAAALLRSLGVKAARPRAPGTGSLTRREHEVLALLAEGLTNRQIAQRLYLSPKTVEHHVRSVLFKLDLSNRTEAAAFAVRTLAGGSARD